MHGHRLLRAMGDSCPARVEKIGDVAKTRTTTTSASWSSVRTGRSTPRLSRCWGTAVSRPSASTARSALPTLEGRCAKRHAHPTLRRRPQANTRLVRFRCGSTRETSSCSPSATSRMTRRMSSSSTRPTRPGTVSPASAPFLYP